ncbi:AzlD domain-containing protein [Subtercola vilae]|uniref:AzlD domain-containing protein n=1 Tax=Subtercola vilae TaxID=2056433 RepID=A0A4T2C7Q0_9MICO|nr:AzlD domain-containing protein [Subtercola vilae]TIH39909.1 AzlD domain-containing protein [Subtercola vilae]
MTLWQLIILASIVCFALKFAGYLIPPALIQRPTPARVANLLTVALLAGLIAVQTFGKGEHLVLDARVSAILAAAGLYALKVPFIVVVIVAAALAAGIRALT